jgi:hypothetical protein
MCRDVENAPQLRIGLINEILSEAICIRVVRGSLRFFRWTTVLLPCRDATLRWSTIYVICSSMRYCLRRYLSGRFEVLPVDHSSAPMSRCYTSVEQPIDSGRPGDITTKNSTVNLSYTSYWLYSRPSSLSPKTEVNLRDQSESSLQ